MNGKYCLDILIAALIAVENIVVNGNEGCLPVVSVDHLRLEVDVSQQLEHRAREEYVSLSVVVKAVKTVSCEVVFVIKQVICNAVYHRGEYAAVLISPCNRHGEIGEVAALIFQLLLYLSVVGYYHAAVVALFIDSAWQRACYVCKSARSYKRQSLAGCI